MWWFWFFSSHLQKQTDFWICPLLSVFNDAADWVLDFTLRVTDAQSALWNPDQLGCIRCGSEWNSLFIASAVKHRRRTVLLNNLFQHINFPKYINVYCRHIDYNVQYIYIYDRVIAFWRDQASALVSAAQDHGRRWSGLLRRTGGQIWWSDGIIGVWLWTKHAVQNRLELLHVHILHSSRLFEALLTFWDNSRYM